MAIDQAGIMALPEADAAAMPPQLSLDDSYDAVKSALQEARPDAAADMDAAMQEMLVDVQDMSDEEIDAMINVVQQMHDNPEQYPQLRAQLIADGQADEEDLPPEYDPEFLAMALSVLMEAKRSRMSPVSQTPQGFAKGGIASAAESLAKRGRYGDTMLAHITPREAQLLRKHGGSATINPKTGLPEFFLKKLFKKIGKAVKKFLGTKIGKIIGTIALATFLGPVVGTTLAMPLASGITTLGAGGNLKDAFKSAAFAYIAGPGNPVSNYVSGAVGSATGLTGTALQAATSGVIGTGIGLLSGQKFGDAVKSGFTSAAMTAGSQMLGGPGSRTDAAPVEDRGTMLQAAPELQAQPTLQTSPTLGGAVPAPVTASPDMAAAGARPVAPITQSPMSAALPPQMDYASGFVSPELLPAQTGNLSAPNAPATVAAGARPNTAAATPTTGPTNLRAVPGAMDSAGNLITNLGQGEFKQAFQSAKDLFFPATPTNADLMNSVEFNTHLNSLRQQFPNITPDQAIKSFREANPDFFPSAMRKYAPLVVGGTALLGATGGFKARPLELSEEQKRLSDMLGGGPGSARDLLNRYPNRFYIQGLPEVAYYGGSVLPPVGAADGGEIKGYAWGGGITVDPTIFPRSWNWENYLRMHPDLGAAGIDTEEEAKKHYSRYGYQEGRRFTDAAPTITPRIRSDYTTDSVKVPGVGMRPAAAAANPYVAEYNRYKPAETAPNSWRVATLPFMNGGIASLAQGGYPRRTGQIDGPGTEKSDSIPAMLSDGEFVMTAKAVRGAGNGSRREGAKKMYKLMHQLERNASRG